MLAARPNTPTGSPVRISGLIGHVLYPVYYRLRNASNDRWFTECGGIMDGLLSAAEVGAAHRANTTSAK
jgi:hypothetical protein